MKETVQVVKCRNCKYFEEDHFEQYEGLSLIVSHENCTKWGGGCKTEEDGYCFLGEEK